MRPTQQDQIKRAKNAYIMSLNEPRDGMGTKRFSVYVDNPDTGELDILWPPHMASADAKKYLLPNQVYSQRKQYPAFHFALSGCQYSKEQEIVQTLTDINPNIKVFNLTGYSPSWIRVTLTKGEASIKTQSY